MVTMSMSLKGCEDIEDEDDAIMIPDFESSDIVDDSKERLIFYHLNVTQQRTT